MRFRWLALFPLLYAAGFAALAWALLGSDSLTPFVRGQLILVRVLALAGCLAAVSAFERGDHLRRAWLALAGATLLVLVRDLLRLPPFEMPSGTLIVSLLGVSSNLALLAGVWLLAHSWRVAAIELPGGRSGGLLVGLAAAALAIGVAGPSAWKQLQAVVAGDGSAVILLVSAVVDILSICLLAPLLLTAVGLRGGLFAWPWALVTAGMFSWLLYDAAASLSASAAAGSFPFPDLFRGLAENFLFAAGLAQRLAVEKVRRL
jgi:hypothetical protein